MQKAEVIKIITSIQIQCPDALKTRSDSEFDILVGMWFECFKEYPSEVVWEATRKALTNTEYQKQNWLGAISREIQKMQASFEKSELDLWSELVGVLRKVEDNAYRYSYTALTEDGITQGAEARRNNAEIFESLSPELRAYIKTAGDLIQISHYSDEQLSYEKGRFLKQVPTIREKAKTRASLPQNFKNLLTGTIKPLIEGDV